MCLADRIKSTTPNLKQASDNGEFSSFRLSQESHTYSGGCEASPQHILSEYSNDLRRSGYPEKFRSEVITAALKTFEKQCAASDSGGTPLFRPRSFQRKEKSQKKAMAKEA